MIADMFQGKNNTHKSSLNGVLRGKMWVKTIHKMVMKKGSNGTTTVVPEKVALSSGKVFRKKETK